MPNTEAPKSNVPEFSVGELASSLKRTLEEQYGRVRVRGELSRVSIAGSGHMYSSIKDEDAVIDAVCWKGNLNKLAIRPEEGLEVICTGRISSYPKSSKYQLIIESMELAGEGALLKMLEERRKKLGSEGLFDDARKKPLPFLPEVIGVITSPTGAVIRDILHRISDRFPRHVILWPVLVQGDGAADQVTAAIQGFNALDKNSVTPRPDLLIVGRGGGSLEDLMAFNEENVVRAVAESDIPVISAVGHETDTTLCDFAADLRSPTPTGAAEQAVPVRVNLAAQILEDEQRLLNAIHRLKAEKQTRLETLEAKLGDPSRILETQSQRLDQISERLNGIFERYIAKKQQSLIECAASIRHPKDRLAERTTTLMRWGEQLNMLGQKILEKPQTKLEHTGKMLDAYSFEKTLERGFAVIRNNQGQIVPTVENAKNSKELEIQFQKNGRLKVSTSNDIPSGAKIPKPKPKSTKKEKPKDSDQHSLF